MAHGGTLVAKTLEAFGVRCAFGLCGDHINPIFDALADTSVRLVDFRDERGAGFAAEGWALATGEPGVLIVTAGPGLANAIGPLADAHAWGVPMVVIAGRVPVAEADRAHPGDMPQLEVVRSIARSARCVLDAERIPEYLARAFTDARSGRPGPAYVEIPVDVQNRPVAQPTIPPPPPLPRPAPDPRRLAEAAAILEGCERPVLIGGSGLWWSGAGDALRELCERWGVPVFLKGAACGLVEDLGLPNPLWGAAATAFAEADAFVVCGTRLDLQLAQGGFIGERPLVQVDIDPSAFHPRALPLVADAAVALRALGEACRPRARGDWLAQLRKAATATEAPPEATGRGVHPARLVGELAARMDGETTIVVDAGELALYAFQMLRARGPSSLHIGISSPLGGVGCGMGWAIGTALARPQRRTILLTGDGAFGFGAMELDTAVRLGLGIEVVVGNDGAWGMIAHLQELLYGRRTASTLGPLRYDELARALGCDAARVDSAGELPAALAVRACGRPRVVDVALDPGVMHPLCRMIAPMFASH